MSDFIVHSVPGSPYGRAVLATLEEKGAAYRLSPVAPGTLRSPEHLARHPFGKAPVLRHGEFTLYESQAILRYLDRAVAAPPLTPSDPKAAGLMDQVLNLNDWYFFQGVSNVIGFQRVVGPRLMGLTPDEAAIAAAMPRAHAVFDELARNLGDKPFLVGDALTLADVMLAAHMAFLTETPEWAALGVPRRNLAAWLARMEARPSFQATTWPKVAAMAAAA
jgi:glutathione S-transferase